MAVGVSSTKSVGDPNAVYNSLIGSWRRSRAFCSGQDYVKALDFDVDRLNMNNVLVPFSPSMSAEQYRFYKAEAELPGITVEFSKMLVGGLLRREPILKLPETVPEEALEWIQEEFGQDESPLTAFLDNALSEEMQTNRTWVFVDYPKEDGPNARPYPVIWPAEVVINWQTAQDASGKVMLTRVIVRGVEESFEHNEFHPSFVEVIRVHELDAEGLYQIRTFISDNEESEQRVISGMVQKDKRATSYRELDVNNTIQVAGKRLDMIPAWPLNGQIEPTKPMLSAIIDKEAALYNKISRRNHLLYGASTYTPYICADITEDKFNEIVDAGLGSWLHLPSGSVVGSLETPTAALADMEKAIAANVEEMAKLGIRMLSPEVGQSGVALDIRNAAQSARIGMLSSRINAIMRQVIAFMLRWRYHVDVASSDVEFKLSEDFDLQSLDSNWMRLVTEWYQAGLLPRSTWVMLLKQNDIIPANYNDEVGKMEITADAEAQMENQGDDYARRLKEDE